ncbi:hypothetical protein [Catenuloplanes atrovinosus]|uniref:YbaB/EbfC DNA-binding family protein n=1 Tax=Catenuloplanes atrovinosus TaxID=137266 RepID=A0AAE3YSB6_9ACTN|nr:hypothetical protein [Catenuloplanes atrovinosus]MDR7278989.1 hypothetical protein [Catenuloplanes atrovinosus]
MTRAFSDDEPAEERKRQLRNALDDLRAGRVRPEDVPGETPEATTGEAADGQVRAVARAGRLDRLEIEAVLMRRDLDELGGFCAAAVTAALRGQRDAGLLAGAPPDLAALGDMLQGVQAEGARAMARIEQALGAVIADLGPRTGMAGDPRATGLDNLLSATAQGLREAGAATRDRSEPQRRAVDGPVAAVIAFGGEVRLELGPELARAQSHEVAAHVVRAVNAALSEPSPAPEIGAPAADLAGLSRRMEELREASLAQMTAYSTALRSIMNRIGEP